jgi:transposase InsO family protein
MATVTQDMKYRQSLICYTLKNGVTKASRKYNRARSTIYFWLSRYDGTIESLANRSKRPHSHPAQHTDDEIKLIFAMRRRNPQLGLIDLWCRLRNRGYTRCPESLYRVLKRMGALPKPPARQPYKPKPYEQMTHPGERVQIDVKVVPRVCCVNGLKLYQYTAIDEFSRLRYLAAYEEQSTYSSADFLKKAHAFFRKQGFFIECVQTDNGFEFTNRFAQSNRQLTTLFEKTAHDLGIRHKLIRPYTPRHNGKVERSHREDQRRFYSVHRFFSLADFKSQLDQYRRCSNNRPMRPLQYNSPVSFLSAYTVQHH